MKHRKVYISCGGTGGHFYPGLSIGVELAESGNQVELLLSGVNSMKQSKEAAQKGISSLVLPKMPSPGHDPRRAVLFLLGLTGGFFKVLKTFLKNSPDYIIIMGSFASAPAYLAAVLLRIPVFLHDGNARIGKANRFMSRCARFLATAFPAVNGDKCRCKVICTGMPVRKELESQRNISKSEAIARINSEFGTDFKSDIFTVLIFGGSQGAATFNRTLPLAAAELGEDIQILHLTGRGKLEETQKFYEKCTAPRLVIESSPLMEIFLGSADTVFCRSGGSSVAELALFGKSAVLIPYPYAAEKHQNDNAVFYTGSGAAEMVEDRDFSVQKAAELLAKLKNDRELNSQRSIAASSAALPFAAKELLKHIEEEL